MKKGALTRNDGHQYFVDSKPIPGTTEVITTAGLADYSMIEDERLKIAQLRGSYVHLTTQLWDERDLNEETLTDPFLKGCLEGYKKFLFDSGFKPQRIEVMDYDPVYWFAGQIDRSGLISQKSVVLDIKPPGSRRHWRWQTAGYAMIFYPGWIPYRLCLSLPGNGTYAVTEHPMADFPYDKEIFLSALRILNERRIK